MLNLIPAILLLLAGGPFGPSSSDAIARIDAMAPKVRVVQLAIELKKAGLSDAQTVLAMVACQEQPEPIAVRFDEASLISREYGLTLSAGYDATDRSRDGPR